METPIKENNTPIKEIISLINEIKEKKEKKEKKTADLKKYMATYMKKRYDKNPVQSRNYKNSLNIRNKYVIDDKTFDKFKDNLHAVVTLKEMIDSLPEGLFETFLMDYKTLHFEKKIIEV
jgi:hypothetical protein